MLKRIIAWILLVGFLILLGNICFIRIYTIQSAAIYAVVALLYWFVLRKDFGKVKLDDKLNDKEE